MSSQNAQAIQILLEAEKEAAKIVQKGRAYRVQRIKDAKVEAQNEIEALKAKKQSEFEEFEKSYLGSTDQDVAKVDAEIEEKIKGIRVLFDQNKAVVIKKMLENVSITKPEIHVNAIPKGTKK